MEIIEGYSEYQIKEAVITSDRTSSIGEIDLRKVITDFTIYEHIEKPYLTAHIAFVDGENVIQDLDFQGGEKLLLTFAHSEERLSGFDISKEFVVDNIERITKADERNEVIILHCTEYFAFESSAQNINRSYTGSPTSIITKILIQYLDKQLVSLGEDAVKDMKLIVPNMNPIEACQWIRSNMYTKEGMPYYLYSTMGTKNLVLQDLGTMINDTQPINANNPYVYAPSVQSTEVGVQRFYAINRFTYSGGEDLMSLIRKGYVGAEYSFYDTMTAMPKTIHFDVQNDVFYELAQNSRLGGENKRHVYGSDYRVKDKLLSHHDARNITLISSSGAFIQENTENRSFKSQKFGSEYRRTVISNALKNFVRKSPLSISVKSREFITGDANYTLGRIIRVMFLDNKQVNGEERPVLDHKKSGDYIIFGAKHNFNQGKRADTNLILGRLGSFGGEFEL